MNHLRQELLCSVQTANGSEAPAGSAGFAKHLLVVELPLPWPLKIDNHELLAQASLAPGTRILGVAAGSNTSRGLQIVTYRTADSTSGFSQYECRERHVGHGELAEVISAASRGDLSGFDPARPASRAGPSEVLICGHDRRDQCCGQFGPMLHEAASGLLSDAVSLRQSSHLGGHRFAPTVLTLPDGMVWAHVGAEDLAGIVDRTLDIERACELARGAMGIRGRKAQMADLAGLARFGWLWLDQPRSVSVSTQSAGSESAGSESAGSGSASVVSALGSGTIEFVSEPSVAVPVCGGPEGATVRQAAQYSIANQTWAEPLADDGTHFS